MRALWTNVSFSIVLTLIWLAYVWLAVPLVPDFLAVPINVLFVPILIGYVGGSFLKGSECLKALLLTAITIVLVAVLASDPAAPSAQLYAGLFQAIAVLIGLSIYVLATRIRNRRSATS